jgi:hypothetical protein
MLECLRPFSILSKAFSLCKGVAAFRRSLAQPHQTCCPIPHRPSCLGLIKDTHTLDSMLCSRQSLIQAPSRSRCRSGSHDHKCNLLLPVSAPGCGTDYHTWSSFSLSVANMPSRVPVNEKGITELYKALNPEVE